MTGMVGSQADAGLSEWGPVLKAFLLPFVLYGAMQGVILVPMAQSQPLPIAPLLVGGPRVSLVGV